MTSAARKLADLLQQQALDAAGATPTVRGANWRTSTVATVNGDGTITTTDGIVARRLEVYRNPAPGDLIAVTVSGAGSWICWGRTTTTPTDAPWTSYAPTWGAGGTNPTLGNGTLTGRYALIGKTCHIAIRLVPGSTTTFGAGTYTFTAPFTAADDIVEYVGGARLSAGSTYIGQSVLGTNTNAINATFPTAATPASATNISPVTPVTLAAGHILRITLTYQTA